MTNVRQRLALAIRRLNVAYSHLENPDECDFITDKYRHLEREVDTAMTLGDERAALLAIEEFEAATLSRFEREAA